MENGSNETLEVVLTEEQRKAEVDALLSARKKAEEEAGTVENLRKAAESDATLVAQSKENIESDAEVVVEKKEEVESNAKKVAELAKKAEDDTEVVAVLVEKAAEVGKSLDAFKGKLDSFTTDYNLLRKKVESLLPGATSAGLASSFQNQKDSYRVRRILWPTVFGACIATMVLAFLLSPDWLVSLDKVDSFKAFIVYIFHRLPIVGPLIWLAIYAGRQHWLADRLAEDYAYKEAISRAFEGYKRELANVGLASDANSPLMTFCNNALRILAESPERIYERKYSDITPLNTITDAMKGMALEGDKTKAAR